MSEKKYSETKPVFIEEESFDLRGYLFKLLVHWRWFVVSFIVCLTAVFLFNRYSTPLYPVKATLLIKDEENAMSAAILEELDFMGGSVNIENEIGILGSYQLIGQVIDSLNFHVSYTRIGRVRDVELYGEGLPITFEILSDNGLPSGQTYRLDFESKDQYQLSLVNPPDSVQFKDEVFSFGQEVVVGDFRFRVNKNFSEFEEVGSKPVDITLHDREELAKEIREQLLIRPINRDASILEVSLESPTPEKATDFINTLFYFYIKRELDQKNEAATRSIEFIDDQLVGIQDSLYQAESILETFKSSNRVVNISQEGMAVYTRLQELEREAANLSMQIGYYNYLIEYLEQQDITNVVSPTTAGIDDVSLNSMVLKLNELVNQLIQAEASASEINPRVMTLQNQIKASIKSIRESVINLKRTSEIALNDLEIRIQNTERELSQLPGNERALVNIQRKYSHSEDLYVFLLQQKAEAGIVRASNVPTTRIVDEAISFEQVFPKKVFNYLVGFFMGLLFPVFLIGIKEYFTYSIQSLNEIERKTNLPILASIAYSHHGTELVLDRYPRSLVSESFRKMRAGLKFLNPEGTGCIMFTSFLSGDGKTFSAINTAVMMAKAGSKTVLVGLDLRQPKIYETLGLPNDQGISNVLIGEKKINEVVQKTNIERLDFVSSGHIPPNPNELILRGNIGKVLESLKSKYDMVVIDTPPIGLVSDALEIGKYADTNLFVVRHQVTPKHGLEFLNDIYEKELLSNVGLIFNGIDFRKFSNNYGRNYGYGYSYGYAKNNNAYYE